MYFWILFFKVFWSIFIKILRIFMKTLRRGLPASPWQAPVSGEAQGRRAGGSCENPTLDLH